MRPAGVKPVIWVGSSEEDEVYRGDTYRTVYTLSFVEAVYVLHVFQKKSRHGIATSEPDMDLIKARLKRAQEFHATQKK